MMRNETTRLLSPPPRTNDDPAQTEERVDIRLHTSFEMIGHRYVEDFRLLVDFEILLNSSHVLYFLKGDQSRIKEPGVSVGSVCTTCIGKAFRMSESEFDGHIELRNFYGGLQYPALNLLPIRQCCLSVAATKIVFQLFCL